MIPRLGVLASGRGSNLAALLRAIANKTLRAHIAVLISDQPEAKALDIARSSGIRAETFPYDRKNRALFEKKAVDVLQQTACDIVVLAGFMRLITPVLIAPFEGRMVNIHPSLLPAFKGLHAQRQALDYGVKIAGCTVHLVTEEMDAGPILAQRAVPVRDDDTEESLSARILEQEHAVFPEAISLLARRLGFDA